jgi:hypothetical protein
MNVLKALLHIVQYSNQVSLEASTLNSNRANAMGDALEDYVKKAFSQSLHLQAEEQKKAFQDVFSYLGNKNNPPDMMLKNGDAIEVKKLENAFNNLALNSSHPKRFLLADSPLITQGCKDAEEWTEKDLLYVIGVRKQNALNALFFVYGDCFVADESIYLNLKQKINRGIVEIPDVDFSPTKELGKIKKVDPLGITDLRIRGMWHIESPFKIFKHLNLPDSHASFSLTCLMTVEKFSRFSLEDQNLLLEAQDLGLSIQDVLIDDPNNPVKQIQAKFITFTKP